MGMERVRDGIAKLQTLQLDGDRSSLQFREMNSTPIGSLTCQSNSIRSTILRGKGTGYIYIFFQEYTSLA